MVKLYCKFRSKLTFEKLYQGPPHESDESGRIDDDLREKAQKFSKYVNCYAMNDVKRYGYIDHDDF